MEKNIRFIQRRLKSLVKPANIFVAVFLLAILVLGNRLRSFSYDSVPHPGEVADEYSYGWVGLSLIENHYPISWSTLSPYTSRVLEKINVDSIYDKNSNIPPFPIVKPWFDHPPLFGLITGGYAYLKGVRNFADASAGILRRPMLKIAILTTLLIFILALRLFGTKVAVLSVFLYSIVPSTIISSRLALMENGYIPLFLGALIFADLYFEKNRKIYWTLAVFLGGIAILIKLWAVAILLSLFLLGLTYAKKDRKFITTSVFLGVLIPLAMFAVYGAFYNWGVFTSIFFANSSRFYGAGAEIIHQVLVQSRFTTTKYLTDGWISIGWISLLILSFTEFKKSKGAMFITIATVSYMVIFILFGSESYGWYKYPFFPFLIISLAKVLEWLYMKVNILVCTVLLFLPFGTGLHRLLGIEAFQKYVPLIRIFSLVFLCVFASSLLKRKDNSTITEKIYMILIFVFVSALSIAEILFFNYNSWFFVT